VAKVLEESAIITKLKQEVENLNKSIDRELARKVTSRSTAVWMKSLIEIRNRKLDMIKNGLVRYDDND
jgi:hypothetical protein